jgi:hypothetical protein
VGGSTWLSSRRYEQVVNSYVSRVRAEIDVIEQYHNTSLIPSFAALFQITLSIIFAVMLSRVMAGGLIFEVVVSFWSCGFILSGKLVSDGERSAVSLRRPRYDHIPILHFRLHRRAATGHLMVPARVSPDGSVQIAGVYVDKGT